MQAGITKAINQARQVDDEVWLSNPSFKAHFTKNGLALSPLNDTLVWRWEPIFFNGESSQKITPDLKENAITEYVNYDRGELVERYTFRRGSIEQNFIIDEMPRARQVCIQGHIHTEGLFTSEDNGGYWSIATASIRFKDVTVVDASGEILNATVELSQDYIEIFISEIDMADAQFPISIDPIIGPQQRRYSDMGTEANRLNASRPAIAHNTRDNNYLVVWQGDDNVNNLVDNEREIFGQLISSTGLEIGDNDFRISNMGPDGNLEFDVQAPTIAYNSIDNNYLVVWDGSYDSGNLVAEENEIFGQLITAEGLRLGGAIRISDMGPDGNIIFSAVRPSIAYNSVENNYLVVWDGVDDLGNLVEGPSEIFGQLISAIGSELGDNDFRISSARGRFPSIAYNSAENNYLVVWEGVNDSVTQLEIFGQLISAIGSELGNNNFRISDMGPDGNPSFTVRRPSIAYNSAENNYLVVWEGDDDSGNLVDEEFEIFGQLISASGSELGDNDFRISDMGPDGNHLFQAFSPSIAYNSRDNNYLVVWHGEDDLGNLVDEEFEIFGQLISASGSELGDNDFRISDMGPDGNHLFQAFSPSIAYNSRDNNYLVVWHGEDDLGDLIDNELEIFGQFLSPDGVEIGANDIRFSDMGDTDSLYDARDPSIAYNSVDNNYLIIWEGDDNTNSLQDEEFAIFGQIVASDGQEIRANDIRISNMGSNSSTILEARDPHLAYNSNDNNYLVVWHGEENESEFEIYGQLISETGLEIGADFQISDIGNGASNLDAFSPRVAYNPKEDNYLVVWYGDETDNDFEIFGQIISRIGSKVGGYFPISNMGDGDISLGAFNPQVVYNTQQEEYLVIWEGERTNNEYEIFGQFVPDDGNINDFEEFRISDMGPEGNTFYDAINPVVAYNTTDNGYLVVWEGNDNTGDLEAGEFEIFGQLLNVDGIEIKGNDFRISNMGPNGENAYDATSPAITYNAGDNHYHVIWSGDSNSEGLVDNEFEIFGQVISASGEQIGHNDFRISAMGGSEDPSFDANRPALIYNSHDNNFMVVWEGDHHLLGVVEDEFEIFGSLIDFCPPHLSEFDLSSPISTGEYNAEISIISSDQLEDHSNVLFRAGDSILLKMGFEVEPQTIFEALIEDCSIE